MGNLTAFMIVRNGELLLPRCLASLAGAVDEVVVLDTGSADGTRAILAAAAEGRWPCRPDRPERPERSERSERPSPPERPGSPERSETPHAPDGPRRPAPPHLRWQEHPFADFGSARQAALELVETEWALWIDADEALSTALRERLGTLREPAVRSGPFDAPGTSPPAQPPQPSPLLRPPQPLDAQDAWEIHVENRVLGRFMRGRNLGRQSRLRLFRTRLGRISPSLVHEGVVLAPGARVGRIEEPILHEAMTSWRAYLAKVDLYTSLEAAEPGARFDPLHLIVTGPATIWREYVWRGGWRDGWPGFVWAATTAWSSVLRDLKRARREWAA